MLNCRSIIRLDARTFHPDLPLCPEPSNCSSLIPSGRFSNTTGCLSVFDMEKDFVLKYIYGKTAAIVQMMCVPIQTLSLRRQVMHTKFNRPDASATPSGYGSIQVRISIWKASCTVFCPDALCLPSGRRQGKSN
jgi:hypothetical protein